MARREWKNVRKLLAKLLNMEKPEQKRYGRIIFCPIQREGKHNVHQALKHAPNSATEDTHDQSDISSKLKGYPTQKKGQRCSRLF